MNLQNRQRAPHGWEQLDPPGSMMLSNTEQGLYGTITVRPIGMPTDTQPIGIDETEADDLDGTAADIFDRFDGMLPSEANKLAWVVNHTDHDPGNLIERYEYDDDEVAHTLNDAGKQALDEAAKQADRYGVFVSISGGARSDALDAPAINSLKYQIGEYISYDDAEHAAIEHAKSIDGPDDVVKSFKQAAQTYPVKRAFHSKLRAHDIDAMLEQDDPLVTVLLYATGGDYGWGVDDSIAAERERLRKHKKVLDRQLDELDDLEGYTIDIDDL